MSFTPYSDFMKGIVYLKKLKVQWGKALDEITGGWLLVFRSNLIPLHLNEQTLHMCSCPWHQSFCRGVELCFSIGLHDHVTDRQGSLFPTTLEKSVIGDVALIDCFHLRCEVSALTNVLFQSFRQALKTNTHSCVHVFAHPLQPPSPTVISESGINLAQSQKLYPIWSHSSSFCLVCSREERLRIMVPSFSYLYFL